MNGQVRLDVEVVAPGKPGQWTPQIAPDNGEQNGGDTQKEHEPIMEDGGHVPI